MYETIFENGSCNHRVIGTAVGDPVEANWVGEKFSRNGSLLIGSVKGNIGYICFLVTND